MISPFEANTETDSPRYQISSFKHVGENQIRCNDEHLSRKPESIRMLSHDVLDGFPMFCKSPPTRSVRGMAQHVLPVLHLMLLNTTYFSLETDPPRIRKKAPVFLFRGVITPKGSH